jgi:hypothetical protein
VSRSGLLPLLVALVAAALLAPASASALVVGIADQKPDMFGDPVFTKLGVSYTRMAISWDAMEHPWEQQQVDTWLDDARAAGVTPLISFGHSRVNRRKLPTPARFKYDFRLFRARYPWVTTFATWNEANHCGEPTCHRPQLVGAYYRSLQRECPTCTILAAETLDMPNMASWIDAFQKYLGPGDVPRYWGLHNYIDANRLRTSGTRTMLRHAKGQIWFTETGGIVDRSNKSTVSFPESTAHAATATRWVFDELAPLSRRITRVYLYHWNAVAGDDWDSGLIDPHGHARPALTVVRNVLRAAQARARQRAASALSS